MTDLRTALPIDLDLSAADSVALNDTPFMRVFAGRGSAARERTGFVSSDGRCAIGVASYPPLTLAIRDWPVDEFMQVVEGRLELGEEGGEIRIFGPGDSFVMPRGFSGRWHHDAPLKKIFVVYHADAKSSAG